MTSYERDVGAGLSHVHGNCPIVGMYICVPFINKVYTFTFVVPLYFLLFIIQYYNTLSAFYR